MSPVLLIAIKALAAGLLVVAFSMVGAVLQPKRFAGIFSAAPAVALASLLLTAAFKGAGSAIPQTTGMIIGSVAMIVYCAVTLFTVDRFRALVGSLTAWLAWFAVAGGLYLVLER
jgi:hypothetical protein